MAEDNFDRNRRDGPGDSKLPPKTWLVWLGILALIPVLMMIGPIRGKMVPTRALNTISELQELIAKDKLVKATIRTSAFEPIARIGLERRVGVEVEFCTTICIYSM